jgi:hypothetical protein
MVSGFLTSPRDHERILSGDAKPIFIYSKLFTSNKEQPSLVTYDFVLLSTKLQLAKMLLKPGDESITYYSFSLKSSSSTSVSSLESAPTATGSKTSTSSRLSFSLVPSSSSSISFNSISSSSSVRILTSIPKL